MCASETRVTLMPQLRSTQSWIAQSSTWYSFTDVDAFISMMRQPSASGISTSTRTSTPSYRNVASKIGKSAPPSMSSRVLLSNRPMRLSKAISTEPGAP